VWTLRRLGLEYRHEEQGREILQVPKGENGDIPPQDELKRPHTGNKELKAIPKPIHNILPGREDEEVNKNAYLDTIVRCILKPGIYRFYLQVSADKAYPITGIIEVDLKEGEIKCIKTNQEPISLKNLVLEIYRFSCDYVWALYILKLTEPDGAIYVHNL